MRAPPRDGRLISHLETFHIPFSVVSVEVPGAPCVTVDNAMGVALAVDYLVQLGHTKIAHICGPDDSTDSMQRRHAFLERMGVHGLPVPERYLEVGNFVMPDSYDAMQRLIWGGDRPTAVFCGNDESAVAAIRAAWESGLRVPADLSVIGFDNSIYCEAAIPTITSVKQPWVEMGSSALRLLLDQLDGAPPVCVRFPAELILRNSTSRPGEDLFAGLGQPM